MHVEVGRRVNDVFRARGEEFFALDRFHPNVHGHGCLAESLAPHFDAAVARARVRLGSHRTIGTVTPARRPAEWYAVSHA